MKFIDLQQAVERLASDPRISPTTPVLLEMEQELAHYHTSESDDNGNHIFTAHDRSIESAPLAAIAIDNNSYRSLTLSACHRDDAMAR